MWQIFSEGSLVLLQPSRMCLCTTFIQRSRNLKFKIWSKSTKTVTWGSSTGKKSRMGKRSSQS